MRRVIALFLPTFPTDQIRRRNGGTPALNLPMVFFGQAAAEIVSAIPLEPPARIVGINPAFSLPDRQRLAGVDPEVIQ